MKKFVVTKEVPRDELETAAECGVSLEEEFDEYAKAEFGKTLLEEMSNVNFGNEYKIAFEKSKENLPGITRFSYAMKIYM